MVITESVSYYNISINDINDLISLNFFKTNNYMKLKNFSKYSYDPSRYM